MPLKNNLVLENIYLEELKIERIKNKEEEIDKEKDVNENAQSLELSGKLMRDKESNELFRYIFGIEFTIENKFEISIIYDTYFAIEDVDYEKINEENDKDDLINEFNTYIWPYVCEQIYSSTSKMNIKEKISIPSYGVIMDEQ